MSPELLARLKEALERLRLLEGAARAAASEADAWRNLSPAECAVNKVNAQQQLVFQRNAISTWLADNLKDN